MTEDEWRSLSENERYMLVVMRDEPEEHFRKNITRNPMFVLGVAALIHHVKSKPEYQAGAQ